ncbi:hypothetical protein E2C01_057278 [Portunus trituberculatus]|uniref:Uncharacterized protein n=1 Tax=Portunus trituberculatus TaxID=210409 RepID=A0A5B7H2X6_PORTR|nr:hypothetical protein [Portunus trituberculatus]
MADQTRCVSYFDTQRCSAIPSTLLRNDDTIRGNATSVYSP